MDGNKKIKGRKEHIVVDTLGFPMSVAVHEANIHDSVGAHNAIDSMQGVFPKLKKILADGGYGGQKLVDEVREKFGAEFTVVLSPNESSRKFSVVPLRWIVERSFSWLEIFRRISMDYEFYSNTLVRPWCNSPSAELCIIKSVIEI
ncbi:MAG: transposase [Eggerthellaceae bacterium]|nr:transposase [Eggerthellaceae bacterium]